jgi:hypothetical protein
MKKSCQHLSKGAKENHENSNVCIYETWTTPRRSRSGNYWTVMFSKAGVEKGKKWHRECS